MDYCSTMPGQLVAHHSLESSKIVAWAIPSGWSATLPLPYLRSFDSAPNDDFEK